VSGLGRAAVMPTLERLITLVDGLTFDAYLSTRRCFLLSLGLSQVTLIPVWTRSKHIERQHSRTSADAMTDCEACEGNPSLKHQPAKLRYML